MFIKLRIFLISGNEMDKKNEAILRILSRKAGLPSRTLSKMLRIPISTVHRRVKKLEQEGVIEGYKALINFEKTPWPIGALLMVNLAEVVPGKGHIPKKKIVESLSLQKEIEEIIEVQAADFDLIIKARFENLKEQSNFVENLRCIVGIEEISSAIIIEENVLTVPKIFS
ncbi:winged helix-turn-helix transcriptional regulator [Candidatus Bathyarchaeota archaeon]|nr:winged helix-turn-helix transcriptional regulator [Candidatus Bathyarchaeota archaeon]